MFEKRRGYRPQDVSVRPKLRGRGALGVAAALSVLPAIAAVIDQQSIRALQEYALSMYGASGIDVDPGLLDAVVYTVAGISVLFWLIAAVTSLIGRRLALCTGVVVVLLKARSEERRGGGACMDAR